MLGCFNIHDKQGYYAFEHTGSARVPKIRTSLKLIQEVPTRWNSCFEMLDRYLLLAAHVTQVLYEVRREKSTKSSPPDVLTPNEEEILKEVRDLLAPLATVTKELSGEKSTTLSKCIPLINSLRKNTGKYQPKCQLSQKVKKDLLPLINEKFGKIEEVKMYAVATLCDPRFKKFAFYEDAQTPIRVSRAISALGDLVKDKMRDAADADHEAAAEAINSGSEEGDEETGFWSDFDRAAKAYSERSSGQDTAGGIPIQLRMYLDSPLVSRKTVLNPLVAWEVLKGEYKYVHAVAQEYLSMLATSVPSERLFSHAGLIVSQLRTRLSSSHVQMLVFLRSVSDEFW